MCGSGFTSHDLLILLFSRGMVRMTDRRLLLGYDGSSILFAYLVAVTARYLQNALGSWISIILALIASVVFRVCISRTSPAVASVKRMRTFSDGWGWRAVLSILGAMALYAFVGTDRFQQWNQGFSVLPGLCALTWIIIDYLMARRPQ